VSLRKCEKNVNWGLIIYKRIDGEAKRKNRGVFGITVVEGGEKCVKILMRLNINISYRAYFPEKHLGCIWGFIC